MKLRSGKVIDITDIEESKKNNYCKYNGSIFFILFLGMMVYSNIDKVYSNNETVNNIILDIGDSIRGFLNNTDLNRSMIFDPIFDLS